EPVPSAAPRPDLPAFAGTDWSRWPEPFDEKPLSPECLRLRDPADAQWYALQDGLQLVARSDAPGGRAQPAFLGRRPRPPAATCTTRVSFAPARDGDFAGLLALIDENHFRGFGIEQVDGARRLPARKRSEAGQPEPGEIVASAALPE